MKALSKTLKLGDLIYMPSKRSTALFCKVVGMNKKEILLEIKGNPELVYAPREQIDERGIPVEYEEDIEVIKLINDPDNQIIYLRYKFKSTWIDRLYNWYCKLKGRKNQLQ